MRKLPSNWQDMAKAFILRISSVVNMFKISKEFILNFDETGLLLFSASTQTWGQRGSQQVDGRTKGDKAQRTVIPCLSADGKVVLCTTVWAGKTAQCLPKKDVSEKYPNVLHDYSETHWSTPIVIERFILRLYSLYILRLCREKNLDPTDVYWILLIDVYSSHIDKAMLARIKETLPTLIILYVPAGCTGVLQMCDIEFNAWFKRHICAFVGDYIQQRTLDQLAAGVPPENVVFDHNLDDLKHIFTASISSALYNVDTELIKRSFDTSGVKGTFFNFSNIYKTEMVNYLSSNPGFWDPVKPAGKGSKQATRYADVIGHGLVGLFKEMPALCVNPNFETSETCVIMEDSEDDTNL